MRPANKRGAARLAAVQALYQMDVAGVGILKSWQNTKHTGSAKKSMARNIWKPMRNGFAPMVSGVVESQKKLDPIIHDALTDDWPLSRLDTTLRAMMRAGTWELMFKRDVPVAVIVCEYVDIAKAFFDADEPKMVNAVLDRIARNTSH